MPRQVCDVILLLLVGARLCVGAPSGVPAGSVPVLDLGSGSFRAFMGWRTPTLVTTNGMLQPLREPKRRDLKDEDRAPIPIRESAAPATNWTSPAFDDSEWCRMRGPAVVQQQAMEWNLVCLRGKFVVTDPTQVQGLRLDVSYYGGLRVFVNGTELVRTGLPGDEIKAGSLAVSYPEDAYTRPDGKLYAARDAQDKAMAERMIARVRRLVAKDQTAGVAIPSSRLLKGINVIAVESRRAPISELAFDAPLADQSGERAIWPHAGIVAAKLECVPTDGLIPNVGPVAGIQIGNVSPTETLTVWDYVHPTGLLQPVRLVGARNGTFSGRLMLSSAQAIKGLKATVTEFVQADGLARLPASAVQVRWAEVATPDKSWGLEGRFDRLLSEPPAEVVPAKVGRSGALSAAVVPVWITVRVPGDAPAGDYRGAVTVEAQGTAAVKFAVPVELKVHPWTVPEPKDFATINNICQSPDSVARYYNVPPWSDKHLALIGRSLEVLHQVGNRLCNLNLIVGMHGYGNSESMVKWIKKDDGSFDYDFSAADKYMDVYAKTCGKPLILQVNAWAFPGDNAAHPKWPQASVTVVDPSAGSAGSPQAGSGQGKDGKPLADMLQPPYGTPENEAFWRPVLAELRKRLEKRGWLNVTYIGWLAYQAGPSKEIVEVAKRIWPDGKWIKNSHQGSKEFYGMPVACNSAVWGVGAPYDPDCETRWNQRSVYSMAGRLAYPQPWAAGDGGIKLGIPRWGAAFVSPGLYGHGTLMRYRDIAEGSLQGNIRGVGQVGGDFWPLLLGDKGRLASICTGEGAVTPRVNTLALCSPGPDGAIFNERLEMFREGIQVAEAMIYLQKALSAKRVGDGLARRIEILLDERARQHLRNRNPLPGGPGIDPGYWLTRECTNWRASDAELFALAGEVAQLNAARP